MLPDKEKLVNENLKLVYHVYNTNSQVFSNFSNLKDDFISVGNIGLIKAANTFDPNSGYKFSTYASLCILNEMRMLLRKESKHSGREITESDTITTNGKDGEEISLMEFMEGPNSILEFENINEKDLLYNEVMEIALDRLNPKHFEIFTKRLEGKKVSDIAKDYGFSQTYVSHIIIRSIDKIKKELSMAGKPKSPYAPLRSDYESITEYTRDYQRFYSLKRQGRESEFIPAYGNNKGKAPVKILEEQKINIIPQEIPTDRYYNQRIKGFEEVISLLDNLEKEYISKIKKIRLAKQSLTSVIDMNK